MKKRLKQVAALVKLTLIFLIAGSVLSGQTAQAKNKVRQVALVVGNNSYVNASVLNNPINDATDVAKALKSLGFEVTLKTDSDKSGFDSALEEFGEKSHDANVVLLYYSGHGIQIDGENILVPIDYTTAKPEGGVSANAIQKVMQDSTNGTKLLILDACRDDPFNQQATGKKNEHRGGGLAPMIPLKEFIVMYSTAAGTEASDGKGKNSPYTAALLKHIKEQIPIETLFKRVAASVAQNTNPPQWPANYTAGLTSDFCFAGCGVKIATVAETCHLTIGEGIYEGECKDDKANGQGVQRYADGEYYAGSFKNNLRHGRGKQYLTDGTEISGRWDNGRFVGSK